MKLEARAITVRAGTCPIVDAASLTIGRGELVGLLGPNGAGKSTLVRALAGVLRHEGAVLLDGRPASALPPCERARRLAFLPQERRIEWNITVREVVALGRHPFQQRFARLDPADERAIDRAMAEVGVTALATRGAGVLSGGELARVLLARALAVEAPLLLADEPVAALDPYHQLALMDTLRGRAAAGAGILVVLHDLTLAARFLDRVILMDRGRIAADGPPADMLSPERLEAIYRILPLSGEHQRQRWLLPWQRSDTASGG